MRTRTVTVANSLGLHARPAAMIVQCANRYEAEVGIERNGRRINAKSILDVMMLEAVKGTTLELYAHGKDAPEAIEAIAQLFIDKFGED